MVVVNIVLLETDRSGDRLTFIRVKQSQPQVSRDGDRKTGVRENFAVLTMRGNLLQWQDCFASGTREESKLGCSTPGETVCGGKHGGRGETKVGHSNIWQRPRRVTPLRRVSFPGSNENTSLLWPRKAPQMYYFGYLRAGNRYLSGTEAPG